MAHWGHPFPLNFMTFPLNFHFHSASIVLSIDVHAKLAGSVAELYCWDEAMSVAVFVKGYHVEVQCLPTYNQSTVVPVKHRICFDLKVCTTLITIIVPGF